MDDTPQVLRTATNTLCHFGCRERVSSTTSDEFFAIGLKVEMRNKLEWAAVVAGGPNESWGAWGAPPSQLVASEYGLVG